jgi:uncharacterized protein YceH (UPF0502 family)
MKIVQLTSMEARVIGCLIEKQITTPDQYPLSLNALVNACNQKTNRDPLMDVDEPTVQRTLDDLSKKHLIMERSGFGSRVPKYQHRFCNTEFGTLKLTPQELAIVCELLLRGPQTPGELRPRAARMASFSDGDQVETTLEMLRTREDGPFVVQLPRQAGRRDSAWMHLFSGPVVTAGSDAAWAGASGASGASGVSGTARASGTWDASGPSGAANTSSTSGAASAGAVSFAGAPAHSVAPSPARAGAPTASPVSTHGGNGDAESRIARLETEVHQLRAELDSLKKQLGV